MLQTTPPFGHWQRPFTHSYPGRHVTPQAPHCLGSVARSKHSPPQQLWPAGQGAKQFPQCAGFVSRFAQSEPQHVSPAAQQIPVSELGR